MALDFKNNPAERKRLLEARFSELFDDIVIVVALNILLLLKWDRTIFLWLYQLFSYVPVLKLIPQNVFTVVPQILDAGMAGCILWFYWDILFQLSGCVLDSIKTCFLRGMEGFWIWFSRALRIWAVVAFFRLAFEPDLYDSPLLQEIGTIVSGVFFLSDWGIDMSNFVTFWMMLAQVLLQLLICGTGLFLILALIVRSVQAARAYLQNPPPKELKQPKQPRKRRLLKIGSVSGLRGDVAAEANARLDAYLCSLEPPREKSSCLRVQILNPKEINRDRIYTWNDRNEIYLRLEKYEMIFLLEDDRAYLLGSEQLELRPNIPEVVLAEGRTRSQQLILTYIP